MTPTARTLAEITFRVDGDPKGQPRPRAFSRGGHARVYDPGTAEGWKSCVAVAARPHLPPEPLKGPLWAGLSFLFKRPKAHVGAHGVKPKAPQRHASKPDLDNLAKAVLDALTELGLWADDAQVDDLAIHKAWCKDGERPGCWVTITRLGPVVGDDGWVAPTPLADLDATTTGDRSSGSRTTPGDVGAVGGSSPP